MNEGPAHLSDYDQYRYKYVNGRDLDLTVPVDLMLELSSACNLRCTYCFQNDQANLPFKRGILDFDFAKRLISEAAEIGVHSLKTNYRGESTLHPRFRDITKWAHDLAHGSTLIDRLTNSNFQFKHDRDDIFEGLSYQTKVKVSYDSFNKEVFEAQRIKGDHGLITANIDKFYNWPGRKNEIVIQAVRTKRNRDEDILGESKKRWPSATISIREMVEGRVEKDLSELANQRRDFSVREPCIQAFVRLVVHHDGRVGACCPDIKGGIVLGDANTQTLVEIFNSENAKKLRQSLKNKEAFKSNPCLTCSSFESYAGYKAPWNS